MPSKFSKAEHLLRKDTIYSDGKLTLRYAGKLRHLGIVQTYAGIPALTPVNDREGMAINK
ncbi:hypothetical protein [Glutamicibacter endophyticus]|uniref:hypothetical protein n=1 Tax=Glutamicibacter endophyticus TaxID=1522174 RepID=UPI003AF0EFA2